MHKKGLTLTELLLATAILSVALTGILALFTSCIFLNGTTRNSSIAMGHAQYILEGLKHTSFSSVAIDIANGAWNWVAANITAAHMTPLPNEVITTTSSGTNPLEIAVLVNWNDRGQRARSLTLHTMITNY